MAIVSVGLLAFANSNDKLKKELSMTETERDEYRDEYVTLKDSYMDALVAINASTGSYNMTLGDSCYMVYREHHPSSPGKDDDIYVAVKRFWFDGNDYASRAHARREAEDLLDALEDRIGWRVNRTLGNP